MPDHQPQPPRRVLRAIREHPWAMLPSAHEAMLAIINLRMQGIRRSPEEIQAAVEAARRPQTVASPGTIAILSLQGVITQKADMFQEFSGGTSCDAFGATFRQVLADPNITGILIDVDSPGGSVYGVEELSDLIFRSRGEKPIWAIANSLAASAAYWIASQAEEFIVTPSGEVGSIGVIAMHIDISKQDELLGEDYTYLTYPKGGYKSEGNPHEPLSEEAEAYLEARLSEYGTVFEAHVARARGIKVAKVKFDFGQGRLVGAATAVSVGMADREGTFLETIERLAKKGGKSKARAEGCELPIASEAETVPAEEIPPSGDQNDAREIAMARLRLAGAWRAA